MTETRNPTPPEIAEADLLAFADGRLAPARRAAVEAWLAANPDRAAEVALWQRQNEAIATLYAHTAREIVPERLSPYRIAGRRPRIAVLAAAAVVLLALGLGAGWLGRTLLEPRPSEYDALIAAAVNAHAVYAAENRHAVEVAAAESVHLVSWLSRRLDPELAAPDITAEGFSLVGGRLLPAGLSSAPAAQLMYENAVGNRVTVFVTAAQPGTDESYEFTQKQRLGAVFWSSPTINCTVVGDLPEAQLKLVARGIYRQLVEPRPTTG
jgi:anti-sigma factor RsiW